MITTSLGEEEACHLAHRVATYVLVVPVPDCLFFISVLEVDCDL